LALAWVLRQPNVASALIGASRPEQVEENVKAVDVQLTEEVLDKIEQILP
jgi:aryl-alcohol dehydrogenase-like predicted oxidoreductase